MSATIKLSSPATREFWEIQVLFEDTHLLALDKPAGLLTAPDRNDPARPSLMSLLHAAIAAGKPWAVERDLTYLNPAHRLDAGTSGVILLAKSKPVLVALANQFGTDQPQAKYGALVRGVPRAEQFDVEAKIALDPLHPGLMRVDSRQGKRAKTSVSVGEAFRDYVWLTCRPVTNRTHQIRVHLRHTGLPIVGDLLYGGKPLLLSRLKRDYRLKPGRTERPLLERVALHSEELVLVHPITNAAVTFIAPCPKDLRVALKYLREHGGTTFRRAGVSGDEQDSSPVT
ncbi:MAG: RNA pseudouridine synthase [Verrucomicrobia bacterium]|nr:RNA pseudouridine synthase [Verrucomicrobiota bacterium]